jgi:basic amino acid/polyamine antiporter, APA family
VHSLGELQRRIGLGSAIALVVGEVIGVGIFLTPAGMAKSLGSPLWLLIVWLGMGAVTLCGALCLAELASRFPKAGGGYVYLREAYGPRVAFLFGWMSLLVMDPGLTALFATGLTSYLAYMVELPPLALKAIAVLSILSLAVINIAGVRLGAGVLRVLTVLKLGMLVFLACWGFGGRLGDWSNFVPFAERPEGSPSLAEALAGGLVAAFFSFAGWWDVSKMTGEVREPRRTLPRALVIGVSIVTAAYLLVSAVFLYLVPVEQVTSDQTFAAQAGEVLFGRVGGVVFSATVILVILGSLTGVIMGAPRVYYAMARDGLFFRAIAAVHPHFGTPARAIALQAGLACALVVSGTFDQILAYFFFAAVLFVELTIAAVFMLRRRPIEPADYRAPWYPVTPLAFLIPIAFVLVLLAAADPVRALLGVVVVLLGLPVYQLVYRGGPPADRAESRSS